jgi:hypothetical protein
MSLRPCVSCGRHVRASESACPFCRAQLDPTPTPPSGQAVGRLGRAALFAFGAAATTVVAASVEGCGGGAPLYGGPPQDAAVVTDSGGPGPLYGGPPDAGTMNDAATAPSDDAGNDAGNIAPPYGTPSEDAGGPAPAYGAPPSDAGSAQDAGLDAAGGIAPLYGGSPGS